MKRHVIASVACLGILLGAGAIPAAAQPGAFSPYRGPAGLGQVTQPAYPAALNLLRRGNPLYANYYGLVRPEQDFRRYIGSLQTQTATNQQDITNLETQQIPGTGHGTQFFNTSHYFYNRGSQSGTTGLSAALPQRPQQLQGAQQYQAPSSRKK